MQNRRRFRWAGMVVLASVTLGPFEPPAAAQRQPHPSADNPPVMMDNNPVQALFVQGSGKTKVYMLVGAGPRNITLQVGEEGALLVDTGTAGMANQTIAAIKHLMVG